MYLPGRRRRIEDDDKNLPISEALPNDDKNLPISEALPNDDRNLPTGEALPNDDKNLPTGEALPNETNLTTGDVKLRHDPGHHSSQPLVILPQGCPQRKIQRGNEVSDSFSCLLKIA